MITIDRKEYMRLYRLANRAKLTAQRKDWMTPEKEAEYSKLYLAKRKIQKRARYQAMPDLRKAEKARVKQWVKANPDKRRDSDIKRVLASRLQCDPSDIPADFIALNRAYLNLKRELNKTK